MNTKTANNEPFTGIKGQSNAHNETGQHGETIKIGSQFVNIDNIYQGVIVSGTPGSENVIEVLSALIKTLIQNNHSMCIYDYNYPSLTAVIDKTTSERGQSKTEREQSERAQPYHILDLNDIQCSVRINPIHPNMIKNFEDAYHIAELLVQSLVVPKVKHKISFFEASATLILASAIFFWVKYYPEKADLPHVFWFLVGGSNPLQPLEIMMKTPILMEALSVFKPILENKAADEAVAICGELVVRLAEISTPESYWVFSGEETPETLSDNQSGNPIRLVIANSHGSLHCQNTIPLHNFILAYMTRYFVKNGLKGKTASSVIFEGLQELYIPKLIDCVALSRASRTSLILNTNSQNHLKDVYNIDCIPNIIDAGRSPKCKPIYFPADTLSHPKSLEEMKKSMIKNWIKIRKESETALINSHP